MLLPLIALVIPLMKVMPNIYRWRVRSRVYRWYKELRILERRIREARSKGEEQDVKSQLDRIEAEVRKASIPWSYADELYQLRVARPVRARPVAGRAIVTIDSNDSLSSVRVCTADRIVPRPWWRDRRRSRSSN